MEFDSQQIDNVEEEEEEEYVLLDLDSVYEQIEIPPDAPYVLSGLDTLNPMLIIGDNVKLIGEYEETIGTYYIFTESEGTPLVHEETGPRRRDHQKKTSTWALALKIRTKFQKKKSNLSPVFRRFSSLDWHPVVLILLTCNEALSLSFITKFFITEP